MRRRPFYPISESDFEIPMSLSTVRRPHYAAVAVLITRQPLRANITHLLSANFTSLAPRRPSQTHKIRAPACESTHSSRGYTDAYGIRNAGDRAKAEALREATRRAEIRDQPANRKSS